MEHLSLRNKLATELTNEQLLKLLETKTEVKKQYKNPYLTFISKYNIINGKNMVHSDMLFKLFKFDNPKANQATFNYNLKKYLIYEHTNRKGTYYFIEQSVLDIGKSIEDMLKKKPVSKKQVRNRRKHIEDFLKALNLKPGNNSLTMSVLFDLYDSWCYKYKRKKIGIGEFANLIPIYIPVVNKKYYKVHDDLFKVVSLETIKRISNRNVKEKNKKIDD